jgi:RNA polymerase sigma-70 factor (ECF subfamily)
MDINEDNILEQLKNKNHKALEYIIYTYSNLIFKVVINVLGESNREAASECINDILLIVWNKHHLYDPKKATLKNWILAVSKYKAIDYKRNINRANNIQFEEYMLSDERDIENDYILKEKKQQLLKLLESESKTDREIFIRKYIFDEHIDLLTKKFNLSKGAVYNRLWRTRNSIVKKFNTSYKEEAVK